LDAQRLGGGKEAARIEVLIIVEVKCRTVQLVGTGLNGEAGNPGKRVRVFRRVVVGDELELSDGIDGRIHFGIVGQISAGERDAVEVDLVVKGTTAADVFPSFRRG
jgi:hypothetical protein